MRVGDKYCPGILHAVPAKDGLLVRIRLPGGQITSDQLRAIASLSKLHADGQIEVTSRANIQLRAISDQGLPKVVEGLSAAGLFPSVLHDRVRNIVASPFAGLDAEELLDTRPLVRELDEQLLADPTLANLHPKFSFAINGGGTWFSQGTDDLALQAIELAGTTFFHLSFGGISSGFCIPSYEAVRWMLEAARVCLRIAEEFKVPARARAITAIAGAEWRVIACLPHLLVPCPHLDTAGVPVETPLGICRSKHPDRVSIIPSVPLGRLTAGQAYVVADAARDYGGDLRLAPWRGIVLGSIAKVVATEVETLLQASGLSMDGRDGYRGISACAGITGCDASLADVRSDAAMLASHLIDRGQRAGWTVNISGCEKQCAMRKGATVEWVAYESGYRVKVNEVSTAAICSPRAAIDETVASYARLAAEVYP
jgi:precorrin-3B synthase